MQAGRELDAKVAETLGWKEAIDGGWCWQDQKGCLREAYFSGLSYGKGNRLRE